MRIVGFYLTERGIGDNGTTKGSGQTCGVCASGNLSLHIGMYDDIKIFICNDCGNRILVLNAVSKEKDEFDDISVADYIKSVGMQRRRMARKVLDIIKERYGKSRGRLLDIGCGFGWLLDEARQRGWETYGIEASDVGCSHAWEMGLEVKKGCFPQTSYEDRKMDVITLMDVLEHLEKPREILLSIRNVLKPGGLLVLNAPNSNGLILNLSERLARIAPRIGRRNIFRLYQLDFKFPHLNYFNPRNLQMMLSSEDYDRIYIEQMPVIDGNLRARIGYTNKESASFLSVIGLWMVLRLSSVLRRHDMFLIIAQAS